MSQELIEGFRLSPQQEHLWLAQAVKRTFWAQCAVRIKGPLNVTFLRDALRTVVGRHETLRTNFQSLPGMNVTLRMISGEPDVNLREVDLSRPLPRELDEEVETLLREERSQPLSLEHESPGRFTLVRLAATDQILIISLPALCADFRTLNNLVWEIGQLYAAPGANALVDEPLQYVQFSEWQHELRMAEDAEAGREFWSAQKLKAQPVSLFLNTRMPRIPKEEVFANDPATVSLALTPELAERVKTTAESYGVSESVFLLACWQALLRRLAAQPEITVKVLFDGREFQELQGAMGLFARYLPVTVRFDENLTFKELLEMTGSSVDEISSWQGHFIEGLESQTGGTVVSGQLSIGFEFDEWSAEFSQGEIGFSLLRNFVRMEDFELRLSWLRVGESLQANFYYAPEFYETTAIQQLRAEYLTLLTNVLNNPQAQISRVDILTENEKHLLLQEWNDTRVEYRRGTFVHRLFEEQAERTPHLTAAVFEDQQLSFAELNHRANQVAHYLRRFGVGPEAKVCLLMERSLEMLVGVLSILKAGGAYVPLDPTQPAQRLNFMVSDAQPAVILSQQSLGGACSGGDVRTVLIDSDWSTIAQESEDNPDVPMSSENLAYVIYTSGSTGQPKGTMISHRSVVNLATALRRSVYAQFNSPLRIGLNAPLTFDASVKQLIQMLDGHAIYIVPEHVRRDGEVLLQFIEQQKLAAFDCTPSHLRLLMAAGLRERLPADLVLLGGETWDESDWTSLAQHPVTQFYNVYGPTECTVNTTVCALRSAPTPQTIGRPLANVRVYVLDSRLRPVPTGVPGELYIGGAGVARGYLNQPALTAERFLPDPFSGEPGARLHRSGDLVRYLPDGNLVFLGRVDNQVKVRGFRIELGEIDTVIEKHPSVRAAVVLAREDEPGDKRLVAYVVPKSNAAASAGSAGYSLPNGMTIFHQNKNETDYLYEEIFQKQIYLQHGIQLEDGCRVFDVGANIGMFTLFVSQQCKHASIYAFEPISPLFEKLKLNSNLYGSDVKLFNIGISDTERTETFTYYPRYSMMSGTSAYANSTQEIDVIKRFLSNERQTGDSDVADLLEHADELLEGRFENETHECCLRTLSSVISENNVTQIDLLKIDVQRAEMDVLRGITETDWEKIRQVVMEVHDGPGTPSEGRTRDISELLRQRGFDVVVEQDELLKGTDRYNLYAVHRERKASRNGEARREPAERYVVQFQQPLLAARELRAYLEERLPDYMIPHAFVMLDELPLTRNGKIDRAALPAPGEFVSEAGRDYVAPQTPTEKVLADIWGQVLGLARVSIHESFFQLGGDSIRSIKLRALAQKNGLDFSLMDVFQYQTIHELAAHISSGPADQKRQVRPQPFSLISEEDRDKLPLDVEDAYPLSMLQLGMLFHSGYATDLPMYYNANTLHLKARFDAASMQLAIEQLMARHPVLRTSFDLVNFSQPLQLVHREVRVPLVIEDLRALSAVEQQKIVNGLVELERRTKFDWTIAPLIRFKVHLRSDETFQFTWCEHHSILDGWSLATLTTELFKGYFSLLAGDQPSPALSLAVNYRDFIALEQQSLTSDNDRRYWLQKMHDSTTSTLPDWSMETSSEVQPTRLHLVPISASISEGVKSFAQSADVPVKSALLAAHLKVMSLLSGQSDVVTGLVSNGRPEESDADEVLGLFLNTLPLRVKIKSGSWVDLAREAFQAEKELMPHRRFPMAQLQKELGGQPLFETMFNFTSFHVLDSLKELDDVQLLEWESAVVDINLTLTTNFEMDPVSSAIQLNFQYGQGRISSEKIKAIGDYFVRTLAAMSADPHGHHEVVSLLSERERRILLDEFNATHTDFDLSKTLPALFEEQVIRSPESPAVTFEDQTLTYHELNERSNQVAHLLIAMGIKPDTVVGVCLSRSIHLVVALLAILKAGAAYLPLDPSYPEQRLSFMLADAQVPLVLTDEYHQTLLPPTLAQVICLDRDWPGMMSSQNLQNPQTVNDPSNLAYVIYTSGSTGKPKAAMNEHRAICNRLLWMQRAFELGPTDTVMQKTPYSFDVSVWEFFWPLLAGARLVLARPGGHQEPAYLKALIADEKITTLHFVPSMLEVFLREDNLEGACRSVRRVVCSGEELSYSLQQRFYEKMPESAELHNLYGPTEAAVDVSWWTCQPDGQRPVVPIGKPIANTRLYVLDGHLGLVPPGTRGELYIGGVAVGRGYLRQPELTGSRFLPDPFSPVPGARMYRTGDEARHEADGAICYLGRVDQQVKLRGQRIELGEIEAALRREPGVGEAVVVLQDGPVQNEKRLVGYIVKQGGNSTATIRERLRESLPDYMVPAVLVELQEMPLSANGKIDRKALPEPEGARPELKVEYVAPQTETEKVLEEIWLRVLGLERIGIHDDFFDLGIDSLLATQLLAQVNSSFQIELPLRASFDCPNIQAMAQLVERVMSESGMEQSLADSQI